MTIQGEMLGVGLVGEMLGVGFNVCFFLAAKIGMLVSLFIALRLFFFAGGVIFDWKQLRETGKVVCTSVFPWR